MNFEKMLKKNCFRCHFKVLEKWCKEPNPEVLPVVALGEWAWENLIKLLSVCENVRKARCHEYNLLMDIAVSCLGEKEIKKRILHFEESI